jgi:hypothetical protein
MEKLTIAALLSRDDIKSVIADFQQRDMADAESLILIWLDKDEKRHMVSAGMSEMETLALLDYCHFDIVSDEGE